ncbi:MAG: hypothetical protein ACI9T8_000480 [Candidatus Saccharimonadales bacterium]
MLVILFKTTIVLKLINKGDLMHAAKILRDNGGFPAKGNTTGGWKNVTNAGSQNPEYR